MNFDEWVAIGMKNEWCGPPVCSTHDGVPTSLDEEESFDAGYDPCIHIIRLYENGDVKGNVESSHSPSVWRKATYE